MRLSRTASADIDVHSILQSPDEICRAFAFRGQEDAWIAPVGEGRQAPLSALVMPSIARLHLGSRATGALTVVCWSAYSQALVTAL